MSELTREELDKMLPAGCCYGNGMDCANRLCRERQMVRAHIDSISARLAAAERERDEFKGRAERLAAIAWPEQLERRRLLLIERERVYGLTCGGEAELEELQKRFGRYQDAIQPLPDVSTPPTPQGKEQSDGK